MGNRKGIMENKTKFVISAYEYLKTSPMFKLSLSSKELFHSNFLEWLSNVDQKAFQRLILDMAGIEENDYNWPTAWRVKREYNNFDLCIVAYDQDRYQYNNEDERIDDDDDFRILFVIENKVKSIPYKEQLERYTREAEEKNITYWKNRGNALLEKALSELKKIDNNDDKNDKKYWIGVEKGYWVLKKGIKSESGKKTQRSEVKKLMPATDGGTWKNNKTNFIEYYAKHQIAQEPPIHFILLSLAKNFPEYDEGDEWKVIVKYWKDKEKEKDWKDKEKEIVWKVCNYCDYKSKIENAFDDIAKDLISQIIGDYCKFIECLTTLSREWEDDYNGRGKKFLYSDNINYKKAYQFRIHDLYQKLKFSYLCTQLFNTIKEKYETEQYSYKVYPNNQAGLFKEEKTEFKPAEKYICVNYTYLHGDPLLEINVHPKCENGVELYYAIQVQGNAYEHGIQVKKNDDTISKLKRNQERVFSEMVWKRLEDETIRIIPNWMNIDKVSEWKNAEWMDVPNQRNKGSNKKPYNKYDMNDGTYVYQKYIIQNDVKIDEVLGQMLKDLQYVSDKIKK